MERAQDTTVVEEPAASAVPHALPLRVGAVVLAPHAAADAPALARLGNDPEVARMMTSIPLPFTAVLAARRIASAPWRGRPGFLAAIRDARDTLMGEVGIWPRAPSEPEVMLWLGAPHRGRGHGQAALDGLLRLVFTSFGAQAATAEAYEDNAASRSLFARAGFLETGRAVDTDHPLRPGGATYLCLRLDRTTWEAAR